MRASRILEKYPDRRIEMLSDNMDKIIDCSQCGKEITVGSSYTSIQNFNDSGVMGLFECESCQFESMRRERENGGQYKNWDTNVLVHAEVFHGSIEQMKSYGIMTTYDKNEPVYHLKTRKSIAVITPSDWIVKTPGGHYETIPMNRFYDVYTMIEVNNNDN